MWIYRFSWLVATVDAFQVLDTDRIPFLYGCRRSGPVIFLVNKSGDEDRYNHS